MLFASLGGCVADFQAPAYTARPPDQWVWPSRTIVPSENKTTTTLAEGKDCAPVGAGQAGVMVVEVLRLEQVNTTIQNSAPSHRVEAVLVVKNTSSTQIIRATLFDVWATDNGEYSGTRPKGFSLKDGFGNQFALATISPFFGERYLEPVEIRPGQSKEFRLSFKGEWLANAELATIGVSPTVFGLAPAAMYGYVPSSVNIDFPTAAKK